MSSDLLTTLIWLGSAAGIGTILGWITANWQWFQEQTTEMQKLIKLAIAIVLSLVSTVAVTFTPGDTLKFLQPYWLAIFTAISAVFGTEISTGLAVRFQFWQEMQFVNLMLVANVPITGAMLTARFPHHGNKNFRQFLTSARNVVAGDDPADPQAFLRSRG